MYRVLLIDNYAAPGDGASSQGPSFARADEAIAWCKRQIDEFLVGEIRPAMRAEELWDRFTSFGEDAVVYRGQGPRRVFSGWDYARARCAELCNRQLELSWDPSLSTTNPAGSPRVSVTTRSTTSTWTFTSSAA